MKIDGVDFWGSNKHLLRMWDELDYVGPLPVLIEEKVRVGKTFTIFIQYEPTKSLYHLLKRQLDKKHQCNMSIIVEEPKSNLKMYDVLFKVVLSDIKVHEFDVDGFSELLLTYICKEAVDQTIYDKKL